MDLYFIIRTKNRFCSCDAFAKESLDKVGAGDVMLSTIALCLKSGFSDELSLFSGSLAAAQSVETFANKDIVNKIKILKSIETHSKIGFLQKDFIYSAF